VILLDDASAWSVTTLDRVGESVLDSRVDIEVAEPPRRELALDLGDKRPDQTTPAVDRFDEHVEEARARTRPARPGDGEADQRLAIPERRDDCVRVRYLTAHLA
jgi:hypothetical protein